jgi:hypothetical protein
VVLAGLQGAVGEFHAPPTLLLDNDLSRWVFKPDPDIDGGISDDPCCDGEDITSGEFCRNGCSLAWGETEVAGAGFSRGEERAAKEEEGDEAKA